MTTGLIVAAAVLVLGIGIGLWRRHTDGRFQSVGAAGSVSSPGPASPGSADIAAAGSVLPGGEGSPDLGLSSGSASGRAAGSFGSSPSPRPSPSPAAGSAGSGVGELVLGEDGTLPIVGAGPGDPAGAAADVLDSELLVRLGVGPAQATLLQFSSAFCAPCRALRRISGEVAAMVPGVQHIEVDAESHLDVVRQLGIWRTPTLLVLDADGRVVERATGVPGKPQLIAVLGQVLPG